MPICNQCRSVFRGSCTSAGEGWGARLFEPSGIDGGEIYRQSVFERGGALTAPRAPRMGEGEAAPAWGGRWNFRLFAALQDGRPGTLSAGWNHRMPGSK